MTPDEKIDAANYVFSFLRKNGFPYPTYKESELREDFSRLKRFSGKIIDKEILSGLFVGIKTFKHFCHHYYSVKNKSNLSMTEAFADDDLLMKVIHNRMGISYKETFNITGNMIRQGFRNSHVAFAASIFKPSVAKTIYDHFAPENSIVLDISAGFGQRMLGAMASRKVSKYIGIDPWKETIETLTKIKNFYSFDNKVELICNGSENVKLNQKIDFCFSSPPFYNKEMYNDNSSQAYVGKSLDEFINIWWCSTVDNIYNNLKDGGLFILNMDPEVAKLMIEAVADKFKFIDEYYIRYQRAQLGKDANDTYYVLEKI
jgi:16S rRNA G966 N2-methylase RsmD